MFFNERNYSIKFYLKNKLSEIFLQSISNFIKNAEFIGIFGLLFFKIKSKLWLFAKNTFLNSAKFKQKGQKFTKKEFFSFLLIKTSYHKCLIFDNGETMDYKLLNLKVMGDERGKLISLEGGKSIPFEIRRVYWIYDTLPDSDRGFHAHKDLEQVIVAMDGACEFVLDDGKKREVVRLNRPDIALYIGKNMWREMKHFSYGCKLMVIASEHYDEKEYVRDYGEFLEKVNNH